MTDEISEENLSTGRTRRSAAVASSKAWHTLMPHKKGMLSDNEDNEFQEAEKAEFTRKKRKQLTNDAEQPNLAVKKRGRSLRTRAELFDSVDSFEQNEEVTTQSSQSQGASKRSLSKKTNESSELSPSVDATEKSKPSSVATTPLQQNQHQQENNRPSAVAAPPFVKHGPSIMQRSLKHQPSSQQKTSDSGSFLRSPPPQPTLIKPGYGALNKEQLEEIDREVMKHQFDGFEEDGDEDEEEEEEPDGGRNIVLDDPDDQDYGEVPSRRSKRASSFVKKTPRGLKTSRTANANQRGQSKRGRPPSVVAPRAGARGGASMPNLSGKPVLFNQHHIGGGRPMMINGAPFQHFNYQPGVPTTAFMSMRRPPPSSDVDGGGMMLGSSGPDGRTVKVLRIRQPVSPAGPFGGGPPSSMSGGFGGPSVSSRPSYMSSTVSGLSKEIGEIAERYRNRVVPGTTVQEFSSIVDQVTFELNRVVEDRARLIANNREYVEQLNASHAAQLEFKDKRIQQLENTVDTLQSKLLVSLKRNQLNVLKHETGDAPATQPSSAGQQSGGSALISSGGASTSSSAGALNGGGVTAKREVTEVAGSLSSSTQPAGSQQQAVAEERRRQVVEEEVVEETLEEIEEEVVPHDFEGLEDDEMLDDDEEMLEEEVAIDGEDDDDDQYTLDYRSPNTNQILL